MSFRLSAPNGLNLSRSVHNPKSRFRRMVDYLVVKGEATREEILRDVFGKTIGNPSFHLDKVTGKVVCSTPNVVSRGWGSYLFNISVQYGYINKIRRGNRVFYSVV
jgi:hypothetical protein